MGFIDDLGDAIKTAINAGTFTPLSVTATYGDQPTIPVKGVICFIRSEGQDVVQQFEESAISVFRYALTLQGIDVRGASDAMSVIGAGLRNVFINHGRTVLDTHLTDAGSNRLGSSGVCRLAGDVLPIGALSNVDAPIYSARVEIEIGHVMPLV